MAHMFGFNVLLASHPLRKANPDAADAFDRTALEANHSAADRCLYTFICTSSHM